MKQPSSNTQSGHFANFLCLVGVELILAGAWTLFIALSQNLRATTFIAMTATVIGFVVLAATCWLKICIAKLVSVLGGRFIQLAALAIPIFLSAFFFLRTPGIEALKIIGPLLACIWLIGIEILFFFHPPNETKPQKTTSGNLAILSIAAGYGSLLIPSRVPSLLDGFPWNTPLEFITATLILPFAFFFGQKILFQKAATLLLALTLVAKLALSFFLPQSGLGVYAYFNEEARLSGKWERTYESFLEPSYSQVMQLPYRSFTEMPIESLNRHGFKKEDFWLVLGVNGVIALKANERLVVLVQGASDHQLVLTDLTTGKQFDVPTVKSKEDLNTSLFNDIPYVGNAQLTGSLQFTRYGNARFQPVILKADGSVQSALSQSWLSASALDSPVRFFSALQTFLALLFLGLFGWSLLGGFINHYQNGTLDSVDVYLALTGLILYYVCEVAAKPTVYLLFLALASLFSLIKFLDLTMRGRTYSSFNYLFSLGLPFLLMFLPLDIPNLNSVVFVPQYQDTMEYQMLARNIYVAGDAFLLETPPWAYKVLFPYIAGLLHVLFGQSLSAQFFLNVWSALLSVVLMIEVANSFGLTKRNAFVAASLFFLLTMLPVSFTYFYRFGLIEPVAIMTLLLGAYFGKEGRFGAMFAIGVVTGMLRLNFAGAIFTAITFLAPAFVGGFAQAWGSFIHWLRSDWKRWVSFLVAILLPSLFIACIYRQFHPTYTLTHEMNDQSSLGSALMSLVSVVVGGDQEFLQNQIQRNPQDIVLITLPIFSGLVIALLSLVYRKGLFARLDLRLSLFLLSMLPVYAVLKPIGYFPRYSWSFLPPALILIGLVLQFLILRDNKAV
ncbi:MAG: hypothetical protein HXY38_00665 [Chloroflexi bacterium]|nr:hypothetical protein [Chloroflexota bacterium]